MSTRGDLVVTWQDRRLDATSTATEWPTSRQRPGNYLLWYWGGQCSVRTADSTQCVAPTVGTERWWNPLRELCGDLGLALRGRVQANVYRRRRLYASRSVVQKPGRPRAYPRGAR